MQQNIIFIQPKSKDLGDNFIVRRALPAPEKRSVGPFIFWDHMGPAEIAPEEGMVVRAHPHIGLATITWLFSGEIMHRDSLGNEQMIRPGEVNWMTAGIGIVHSERSEPKKSITLEGIQLWLALPKEHEDVDPSFFHCKIEDVPVVEKDQVEMKLIAGQVMDMRSPVPVYSDLFYFNCVAKEKTDWSIELRDDEEGALYIIDGTVTIDGKDHLKFDMIIYPKGSEIKTSLSHDAKFMFFGGVPFPEKRHLWWNFVSTSEEKIEEAKKKWQEQKFPSVINEEELIPLPNN
ncbi:pirin family protein [Bacteriovoracaceae bacterium]|nr:pirin family protein [Bacteriovoracaceae bacterium]